MDGLSLNKTFPFYQKVFPSNLRHLPLVFLANNRIVVATVNLFIPYNAQQEINNKEMSTKPQSSAEKSSKLARLPTKTLLNPAPRLNPLHSN